MLATKEQKKIIHTVVHKTIKEETVQWATDDNSKTSCNDLTFEQANKILVQFNCTPHKPKFLATFDKANPRHKFLLSLVINFGWWRSSAQYGKVANLDKLNDWMRSNLCPVQDTPLMKMTDAELSKVIGAFESMVRKKFK